MGKNHYWDSLEKDKALILRHMRTFAGEFGDISQQANTLDKNQCHICKAKVGESHKDYCSAGFGKVGG